jgi:hypothetical protein
VQEPELEARLQRAERLLELEPPASASFDERLCAVESVLASLLSARELERWKLDG